MSASGSRSSWIEEKPSRASMDSPSNASGSTASNCISRRNVARMSWPSSMLPHIDAISFDTLPNEHRCNGHRSRRMDEIGNGADQHQSPVGDALAEDITHRLIFADACLDVGADAPVTALTVVQGIVDKGIFLVRVGNLLEQRLVGHLENPHCFH